MSKIFLKFFIASFMVYIISNLSVIQKKIYPFPYRQLIENYSSLYQLDKFLVVAVMKAESNFSKTARSMSGAMGLMQLMPETSRWISQQLGEDFQDSLDNSVIYDPEINIHYGTWYLSELKEEFYGNEILTLAAYNAGRTVVHQWMNTGNWNKNFSEIDKIPYIETRKYIEKVLFYKKKYGAIYNAKNFFLSDH